MNELQRSAGTMVSMKQDGMANTHTTTQIYQEVDITHSQHSVRVLELIPARDAAAEIRINLKAVQISSASYEALWYTWGESTSDRSIIVNTRNRLSVTDNLFDALVRLRRRWAIRTMWVDRICINQADDVERAQQVAIMDKIYKGSDCVNVWLGEVPWPLPTIQLPWCVLRQKGVLPNGNELSEDHAEEMRASTEEETIRACRPAEYINQAIAASTPRWHDRAWTVQEFVLAKEVYLCFGRIRSLYDDFKFASMINAVHRQGITLEHFEALRRRIVQMMGFRTHNADRGFFGMRQHSSNSAVTNSCDQIYAMLALVDSEEASLIGIDYSLDSSQVFAEATYASIKIRNNFDILLYVVPDRETPGLPSWSIDFSSNTVSPRHMRLPSEYVFTQRSKETTVTLDPSKSRLTVLAAPIDIVIDVGDTQVVEDSRRMTQAAVARARVNIPMPHNPVQNKIFNLFQSRLRHSRFESLWKADFLRNWHSLSPVLFQPDDGTAQLNIVLDTFTLWTSEIGIGMDVSDLAAYRDEHAYVEGIDSTIHRLEHCFGSFSLFVTKSGLIGLAPCTIRANDQIVHVPGFCLFIALRPEDCFYTFVGTVFIHCFGGNGIYEAIDALELDFQEYELR